MSRATKARERDRNAPECCGGRARLTSGKEIYPHRPDLHRNPIWVCDKCNGRVGCHPDSVRPLGKPATAETRDARSRLHDLRLDPIWKRAPEADRKACRKMAYAVLAHRMGRKKGEVHVGEFSIEECRIAWRALAGLTADNIREAYDEIQ